MRIDSTVLQDDGEFYIKLMYHHVPTRASAFLYRRCPVTPEHQLAGIAKVEPNGKWMAGLVNPCSLPPLFIIGGEFERRLDAIVGLWFSRHSAFCNR